VEDQTNPDVDFLVKRVGKYTEALQSLVYPPEYDPAVAVAAKRPAAKRKVG